MKYIIVLLILVNGNAFAQEKSTYYPTELINLKTEIPQDWFIDSVLNYCSRADYIKADTILKLFSEAKTYFLLQNDSCRLANVLVRRGRIFESIGAADSASLDFSMAKSHFNSNCDVKTHYDLYLNWGILFLNRNEYKVCDSLCAIALKDAQNIGDPLLEIRILNNIAISKAQQSDLEGAMIVFRNIYNIAKAGNHKVQYVKAMNNIGTVHAILNNLDSAAFYFEMVLDVVDAANYEARLDVYNNLAGIYSSRGETKKAYAAFDQALSLAEKIKDLEMQSKILSNYAYFEYEQGNGLKAYDYLERHIILNDSLQSAEKMRAVNEIQVKYQTAERLREIADLERNALETNLALEREKKNKYISVGVGLLIVSLAIGLLGRLRIIKKSNIAIQIAKQRSDDLLLNILPEDVAEELKETGKSKARSFDDVTIMFADIADFTQQAQQLGPIELVEEINTCFKGFDEIVTRYNVEKIKTIGDAYMAAGGFVEEGEPSAIRMVKVALEMQRFMIDRSVKTNAALNFKMRIGLHSGPVVAGIVGVKKFQYDIWGDTVNTASRMESTCDIGKVNISELTYLRIKDDPTFAFEDRGVVEVKGKGEMRLFFVEYA